jgi:hypothetical protein
MFLFECLYINKLKTKKVKKIKQLSKKNIVYKSPPIMLKNKEKEKEEDKVNFAFLQL